MLLVLKGKLVLLDNVLPETDEGLTTRDQDPIQKGEKDRLQAEGRDLIIEKPLKPKRLELRASRLSSL